jgi:biopolymer transport protein ExbB/TolQ
VIENISPIIQSIASLAWVGFAFTALFLFKSEISEALQRFRKGKILGQEIELGEQLEKLEASGVVAAKEVDSLPREERRMLNIDQEEKLDSIIKSILQQAAREPKVALMTLWAEMERQARQPGRLLPLGDCSMPGPPWQSVKL